MILHILGGAAAVVWIVLEVIAFVVTLQEAAPGCLRRLVVAFSWLLCLAAMLLGLHALDTLHRPWLAVVWWVVCGAALLFGVFQPRIRLRRRRSP